MRRGKGAEEVSYMVEHRRFVEVVRWDERERASVAGKSIVDARTVVGFIFAPSILSRSSPEICVGARKERTQNAIQGQKCRSDSPANGLRDNIAYQKQHTIERKKQTIEENGYTLILDDHQPSSPIPLVPTRIRVAVAKTVLLERLDLLPSITNIFLGTQ